MWLKIEELGQTAGFSLWYIYLSHSHMTRSAKLLLMSLEKKTGRRWRTRVPSWVGKEPMDPLPKAACETSRTVNCFPWDFPYGNSRAGANPAGFGLCAQLLGSMLLSHSRFPKRTSKNISGVRFPPGPLSHPQGHIASNACIIRIICKPCCK